MSRPDHEMKLLNAIWVWIEPAGSPSISSVYSLTPVRAPLAGGSLRTRRSTCTPSRCAPDGTLRFGGHDLMAAADIEVVHQPAVLDVEAVARGRIAMGDQHALGASLADLDMGLDGVAAAAHVGRDVGRHVPHAGVKGELVARAVEARGVFGKARAEAVVERQHIVLLGLAPPQLDHRLQPLGLLCREIVGFRKILRRGETAPICRSRTACPRDGTRPPSSRPARSRDARTFRNIAARILTARQDP